MFIIPMHYANCFRLVDVWILDLFFDVGQLDAGFLIDLINFSFGT